MTGDRDLTATRMRAAGGDEDTAQRHPRHATVSDGGHSAPRGDPLAIDPFRAIAFPNMVRERRQRAGIASLLALSALLPHIPYVRLSKIERGEVPARAEELRAIAAVLRLEDPALLLIDVEDRNFSLEDWAGIWTEPVALNREAEELAMLLAATLRARRAGDPALTLARLQREYRLPAVIVSRLENAIKPFDRWNGETLASVCTLMGVTDRGALIARLRADHEAGSLSEWLTRMPGRAQREARMRKCIRALRAELNQAPDAAPRPTPSPKPETPVRLQLDRMALQVMGVPAGDGLIEPFPGPHHVPPPPGTGPNAYALRMCRPSLGAPIPACAILIVDPDRYPVHDGLAVLSDKGGLRVLAITIDRDGGLYGHSSNPEKQIRLDGTPAGELATVTAILFP